MWEILVRGGPYGQLVTVVVTVVVTATPDRKAVPVEELRYPRREVYPNAPLAVVAAEIRIAYEPRLRDVVLRDAFAAIVRKRLPVLKEENAPTPPPQPGEAPSQESAAPQIRAMDLDATVSISLNPNAILFEATKYDKFEEFLELISFGLKALQEVVPEVWATRVGLRYIDELRIPDIGTDIKNWAKWINPELLGSLNPLPEVGGVMASGATIFDLGGNSTVIFRWGSYYGDTLVQQTMPLNRPKFEPGTMFILDIDAFTSIDTKTEFDSDQLLAEFGRLHKPSGTIFSWAITDHTRTVFRGGDHE